MSALAVVRSKDDSWSVGVYRTAYGNYGYVALETEPGTQRDNGLVFFDTGDNALYAALCMLGLMEAYSDRTQRRVHDR